MGPPALSLLPAQHIHTPWSPISTNRSAACSPCAHPSPPARLPHPASVYHTPRPQCRGGAGSPQLGLFQGGCSCFQLPLPPLRHLPGLPQAPPPPLATLSKPLLRSSLSSALYLMGFKVRGSSHWVWAMQALGVGSLNLAQPTESFRTASEILDPASPPSARCFPTTSSEQTSKSPPTPDVPRTGP